MATATAQIKVSEQVALFVPFTIAEFVRVADELPDRNLELINGEIVIMPPPDKRHQKHAVRLNSLFSDHAAEIKALGCAPGGSACYYEVVKDAAAAPLESPSSNVCPDASILYTDYWETGRRPPALLVVEVLSTSHRVHIDRDLVTKPEIYVTLAIPTYWIVDRRDESVWVYTDPVNGEYRTRRKFQGDEILPAPGLEFLRITPAMIFAE